MKKDKALTKTELMAPPTLELARYDGDEQNGQGDYIVQGLDIAGDGAENLLLIQPGYVNDPDSYFFSPPTSKPFRVPSSKCQYIRKVSWYGDVTRPWCNPWGEPQVWRQRVARLWGQEAADREVQRIESLGANDEERTAIWFAERQALLEAGVITA